MKDPNAQPWAKWRETISVGIVDHALKLRQRGAPSMVVALDAIIADAKRIKLLQTGELPRRKPARRAAGVPDVQQSAAVR